MNCVKTCSTSPANAGLVEQLLNDWGALKCALKICKWLRGLDLNTGPHFASKSTGHQKLAQGIENKE
jgi:hypothetical protein